MRDSPLRLDQLMLSLGNCAQGGGQGGEGEGQATLEPKDEKKEKDEENADVDDQDNLDDQGEEEEAHWENIDADDDYVNRYGILFEDYRGNSYAALFKALDVFRMLVAGTAISVLAEEYYTGTDAVEYYVSGTQRTSIFCFVLTLHVSDLVASSACSRGALDAAGAGADATTRGRLEGVGTDRQCHVHRVRTARTVLHTPVPPRAARRNQHWRTRHRRQHVRCRFGHGSLSRGCPRWPAHLVLRAAVPWDTDWRARCGGNVCCATSAGVCVGTGAWPVGVGRLGMLDGGSECVRYVQAVEGNKGGAEARANRSRRRRSRDTGRGRGRRVESDCYECFWL